MKILRESLFEREEETRFSGRYVPPQYRKVEKKRTGEDGPSKDPYDNRGARTYKGKATQSEFNKVLGKAIENDKDYIPEPHSYTPREFGKHLRPFKEAVTNKGLLTKFDKVKPEEIRKLLLLSLDATELPNDIRVYIEEKIIDANDALTLAKLVLKYTTYLYFLLLPLFAIYIFQL